MQRPFALEELDHVVLRCVDTGRALRFYVDVLGCTEERRIEAIGLIQLRAGRSLVDLLPADRPPDRDAPNVDHVCLGITATSIDAVVTHLRTAGVELLGDPALRYGARGMGMSIYVRDPEGNVIELKCLPDGSSE